MAARPSIELDELVDHWTALEDERVLVGAKRGAARLGFALRLKFYTRHGRFPAGGSPLPVVAVEFVARQMEVAPADLGSYEWSGRSIERHRAQIREHLGFRECTVADAEQLTAWLAERVDVRERRPERVRDELLAHCRSERIEPPAPGRVDRIVRSALRAGEETLSSRVVSRLSDESKERIAALVAVDGAIAADVDGEYEPRDDGQRPVLGKLKEAADSVSLETMLSEINKLLAVRAIGVGPGVFGDIAPSVVVGGWRARAAVESPAHLRTHPEALRLTLVAALLRERDREITDTLVELLISTVEGIDELLRDLLLRARRPRFRGARLGGQRRGRLCFAKTAQGAASSSFQIRSPVSLQQLFEVVAEFDRYGGASLGLVAWELCVEEQLVAAAWQRATRDGLIAPAGRDRQEQLWRPSPAGWAAAANAAAC